MYEEDGSWFFKTREGGSVGPFRDELETSTRLEVYIRMVDSGLLAEEDGMLAGGIVKIPGNGTSAVVYSASPDKQRLLRL